MSLLAGTAEVVDLVHKKIDGFRRAGTAAVPEPARVE